MKAYRSILGSILIIMMPLACNAQSLSDKIILDKACQCGQTYLDKIVKIYNEHTEIDVMDIDRSKTDGLISEMMTCMDLMEKNPELDRTLTGKIINLIGAIKSWRTFSLKGDITTNMTSKSVVDNLESLKRWCPDMKLPQLVSGK
jgi:hypothetical protein